MHFGLIITLNLMIGLLHPPLGMVLFVLSRVAKLSVERTTMAILPWLVPLFIALFVITFIPQVTLWLPTKMGLITAMTTALAATLYGPEGPPPRWTASSPPSRPASSASASPPAASAARTCTISATAGSATSSPPRRSSSATRSPAPSRRSARASPASPPAQRVAVNPLALVRPLPALPRRPAEPLREHLLHGLGLEDPAHAGRLRHALRRHPRPVRAHPRRTCPSRPPPSASRSPSACTPSTAARSRASRVAIIGAGPIGLLTLLAARMSGATEVTLVDVAAAPLAFATASAPTGSSTSPPTPRASGQLPAPDVVIEAAGIPAALGRRHQGRPPRRHGGAARQPPRRQLPGAAQPGDGQGARPASAPSASTRSSPRPCGLISEGRIDVLSIVTARRPLAQVTGAFALALDRSQSVKVVLTAQ